MPVLKIISGATIQELLERAQELLDPAMTPSLGNEQPSKGQPLAESKAQSTPKKSDPGPAGQKKQSVMVTVPGKSRSVPVDETMPRPPRRDPTAASSELSKTVPKTVAPRVAQKESASIKDVKTQGAGRSSQVAISAAISQSALASSTPTKTAHFAPSENGKRSTLNLPSSNASSLGLSAASSYQNSEDSGGEIQASSSNSSVVLIEDDSTPQKNESEDKVVPLSFAQARFWFLQNYLENPTTFNVTASISLQGPLRTDALAQAVTILGQRHEALRTRFFVDEKGEPAQAVSTKSYLRLEQMKLSSRAEVGPEFEKLRRHVYDLAKGELLRIILLEVSPNDHQILLGYHHINMDGISFEILFADLERAYNSGVIPSDRVLQYPDFALSQKQDYANGVWADDISYWKGEFQTSPQALPLLPISKITVRPSLQKYESHLVSHRISPALSAKVADTCKRIKVSPFQFYLAVFKILITRLIKVDEVCIGVADANRNNPEQQNSLGCYLNLLPIKLSSAPVTFGDAVKEARHKAQLAFAHSNVPFDIILNELNVPRSSQHSPLFQIFLNYRQGVAEKRTFAGCDSEWTDFDGGRIAYDLSLDIVDNAGENGLLRLFTQSALYDLASSEILMNSLVNLVEAFARNPAARVTRPPLTAVMDEQKFIKTTMDQRDSATNHQGVYFANAVGFGRLLGLTSKGIVLDLNFNGTLVDRIDHIAQENPRTLALVDGVTPDLTYSGMIERINVIAETLHKAQANFGLNVGVFMQPSNDWICSLLAIMRVGAVYVPLDPRTSIRRLAMIAQDCQPVLILVDSTTKDLAPDLNSPARLINVTALRPSGHGADVPNKSQKDSAFAILYTSGSTGVPKGYFCSLSDVRPTYADGLYTGIEMRHGSLTAHVETVVSQWMSTLRSPVALQHSSYSFDMSLVQIFWPLSSGGRVVTAPQSARRDPVALTEIISKHMINLTAATPSEYNSWLEYGKSRALVESSWTLAIAGGEVVPTNLIERLKTLQKADLRMMNCYGPTEITFFSHWCEIQYSTMDTKEKMTLKPWFNFRAFAVDENRQPLPAGESGEIAIGGMGVTAGYVGQPALSSNRFARDILAPDSFAAQGWNTVHFSGDKGRVAQDGTLELEGRIADDTQVKLRGLRIDLREVETVLAQQSQGAILHVIASVVQLEDSDVEVLAAHVEFSANHRPDDAAAYVHQILQDSSLPQYMRPGMIVPLDKLPRTDTGKLDRRAVKNLQVKIEEPTRTSSTGAASIEARLRQLWRSVLTAQLLDQSNLSPTTDFFQVGGTSILLVTLRSKIEEAFHIDIPLAQLFDSSTFGKMAKRIRDLSTDDSMNLPIVSTGSQPSPDQAEEELSSDVAIDWTHETSISKTLVPATVLGVKQPRVVIMTGSTGFLGKAILKQLLEVPTIRKIYCIAIRPEYAQIDALFTSSKIVVLKGDQALPLLGLPQAEITPMLTESDAIIHNGADVSFLKSYDSLRAVNVDSTRQLAEWAIEHGLQFHYVSTASVANLSGRETFPAVSARNFAPATDGSNGYIASKWASEVLLENFNAQYLLPLVVHRPSSITGAGAPETDMMSALVRYSRQLLAVPRTPLLRGWIDMVAVESVAQQITRVVSRGHEQLDVQYVYESGEVQLKVEEMRQSLESQFQGETVKELEMDEWVRRAEVLGMNQMIGAFLRGIQATPLVLAKPVED
jgi:hybrid polyketide synthase/nonribosomal peptide synthetase ACE1